MTLSLPGSESVTFFGIRMFIVRAPKVISVIWLFARDNRVQTDEISFVSGAFLTNKRL